MADILQVVGAVLVLLGFFGTQVGVVDAKSLAYLVVNALGSGVLAVLALLGREWGFLLLEGVWCVVAVVSLAGVLTRGRSYLWKADRDERAAQGTR
jgi:hypothetical protein